MTDLTAMDLTASRGTLSSVAWAIASVREGLTFEISENDCVLTVIVDDGSGGADAPLLAEVKAAVREAMTPGAGLMVVSGALAQDRRP